MKNTLLIILTIIFSAGIGILVVYIPMKQQALALSKKITSVETENKSLKEKIRELQTRQSEKILVQKEIVKETEKAGLAYFTSTVTPISAYEKQVDIYLKGSTSVDAVDLVLSHKDTVSIKEIKKGTVFASYPRLLDKDGIMTATGIAIPQGDTFVYGKTGGIYVTLIVQTAGANEKLDLVTKDTQAYFSGTPVLDFTSSFTQISL